MVLYKCPKCGRTVEKPPGRYFCAVCGPGAIMEPVQTEVERAMEIVKRHPAMHAVWNVLDLDKTLSLTTKNVLWQDFVAAWNRRGLLTNEEADLLIKLRFG